MYEQYFNPLHSKNLRGHRWGGSRKLNITKKIKNNINQGELIYKQNKKADNCYRNILDCLNVESNQLKRPDYSIKYLTAVKIPALA